MSILNLYLRWTVTERRQFMEWREEVTMLKSSIAVRVERLQYILNEIDMLNDRARLLAMLIEKEDRKEKDLIRYGPNPTA